ncbi:two-component sensor histidine kinase [Pontibacterium sp. N1Y112]|uniref:histidine kinase n=1 Tax=Pontibacterium sinense TaxID=2781979 RepID=A0A8J7K926_9GAMM|nr:ATP-binding protein [Pontibacterium sinense]MBE9396166.1 two-component sensor histidine kinase [Pontibacterium sinense]
MASSDNPYEVAYTRERSARLKAEQLLEDKARELYFKNQKLEESYKQLKQQQALTMQNEKLATLGTLSAGVAHEINNPLAFVLSNLESLPVYKQAFMQLLKFNQGCINDSSMPSQFREELKQLIEREDLEFLSEDMSGLIDDTVEGIQRVKEIVQNLRSFSRTQGSDYVEADLLEGISSTIKLLNAELKNSVTLKLDLDPLPRIVCNPNQLNQVFLNLIMNAKHALADSSKPLIKVTTSVCDEIIHIRIADNGCGMPPEVLKEIFVPFYTTKPIGQGTGMGLAIAYGIVRDHGGKINVRSQVGRGTVFDVELPVSSDMRKTDTDRIGTADV